MISLACDTMVLTAQHNIETTGKPSTKRLKGQTQDLVIPLIRELLEKADWPLQLVRRDELTEEQSKLVGESVNGILFR